MTDKFSLRDAASYFGLISSGYLPKMVIITPMAQDLGIIGKFMDGHEILSGQNRKSHDVVISVGGYAGKEISMMSCGLK